MTKDPYTSKEETRDEVKKGEKRGEYIKTKRKATEGGSESDGGKKFALENSDCHFRLWLEIR